MTVPGGGEARVVAARRVALISSSFHPYPGGVEEHVRNVARELRVLGHEVVVWTVDRGEHLGTAMHDGVEVRYLPTPLPAARPGAALRFLRDLPAAWSAWRRAFRDFRPDILNIQCFGPNGIYALALHHRTGVPLVLSSHGETFVDPEVFEQSRLLTAALTRALRDSALVTGCSALVLQDLRRHHPVDGVVVPNGVDLDEAGGPAPDRDERTILAVGRLVRVKGFDLLLRAFARARLDPGTRLVIAGDGPARGELERLAADLGVGDRVEFTGRLDRAGVVAAMAGAGVVVVPSRIEAFGIVVLEAWRSGAALVATTRGGPADIVTDGVDGILVDPEDVDALAAALARVAGDPALRQRLASAGRERVTSFTWQRTAVCYAAAFDGVTRGGGGHA